VFARVEPLHDLLDEGVDVGADTRDVSRVWLFVWAQDLNAGRADVHFFDIAHRKESHAGLPPMAVN
jgi:hypothetical protein